MTPFAEFEHVVRGLRPATAIVLGSGLSGITSGFREAASIAFSDVPGLAITTVKGHAGRLVVGWWADRPVLLFLGRLHIYEGHSREVVSGPVRLAADLGVKRLILTNAAGGIRPGLVPGSLMAIRAHLNIVGRDRWCVLANGTALREPYSQRLIQSLDLHESENGRELPVGIYAALTGPCYETPAEIRALAACGADAVGMSTALEAEAAAELGLEVAAISCITNKAAGLGGDTLNHAEVLANAQLAVERLGRVIANSIQSA
jgi:purine-nucleoside phosphorylase